MALFEKVYFPSPPPTSNTLTPMERACLRRSTTKLGRVLGVTPRLLDVDDFDAKYSQRTSETSHVDTVPVLPISSPVGKGQHASSTFTPRDFHTDECHRSKGTTLLVENGESKLGMKSAPIHHLPLIRVARPLHSQHVSKLNHTSPDSSESEDSDDDTPDSISSLRRKKMERLCRILGEELPVSIVFPESKSDDSGYDSDNGHWQKSAASERPNPTVRTPCHSSPSPPTPTKLQTDQAPLPAGVASSPTRPRFISGRDFSPILFPIPPRVPLKGSSACHPHYRLRSSTCGNRMHPGSQIDNSAVPRAFDLRSLRTISESSREGDDLSRMPSIDEARWKKTGTHGRDVSLLSHASYSSLRSEWYPSDEDADSAHTDETLVEKKETPATQGSPTRVWSHKRKPPPAYEP